MFERLFKKSTPAEVVASSRRTLDDAKKLVETLRQEQAAAIEKARVLDDLLKDADPIMQPALTGMMNANLKAAKRLEGDMEILSRDIQRGEQETADLIRSAHAVGMLPVTVVR